MAQELKTVRVEHAALDETPLRGGTLILRGVISYDTLKNLKIDDYQREAAPLSSLGSLMAAVQKGDVLPDIEIGMRGSRTRDSHGSWLLLDDCYIIDGQQRVNACINVGQQHPELPIRLGAAIHFDTDRLWERDRFRVLNSARSKVSPNVLLRNLREDHPSIQMLYTLTDAANTGFCLAGRTSWAQKMRRGDLMTSLTFAKVVARLHSHLGAGMGHQVDELASQLDAIADRTTLSLMRDNARVFFSVLDEIWGVRATQYRELAPHLKGNFLYTLARLFSNHTDFWKNAAQARLFIDADTRRKLSLFKLRSPEVAQLASSTGPASHILYGLIVQHLNSGKIQKNRLKQRPTADVDDPSEVGGEPDDSEENQAA